MGHHVGGHEATHAVADQHNSFRSNPELLDIFCFAQELNRGLRSSIAFANENVPALPQEPREWGSEHSSLHVEGYMPSPGFFHCRETRASGRPLDRAAARGDIENSVEPRAVAENVWPLHPGRKLFVRRGIGRQSRGQLLRGNRNCSEQHDARVEEARIEFQHGHMLVQAERSCIVLPWRTCCAPSSF